MGKASRSTAEARRRYKKGGTEVLLEEARIFIVLSESKSFSQAADRLYLSRPGLSQKIAKLEAQYDIKLYDRTAKGIKLTPAGQIFTKFAKNVASLERTLSAELKAIDESFNSTIEVGMSFADGSEILPRIVKRFLEHYPNEYIHLDAGYEPELIEKLKEDKLDFAILENMPLEDGISHETLGYKQLVFLAPNMAPYSVASQPVSVETLFRWPCVSYERESGFHLIGNRIFRERYGMALRSEDLVVQFDTYETRVSGIKEGLGWAAMPEAIADRYRNDPGVIRLKLDTAPLLYPVDIAWRANYALTEQAQRFKKFIKENLPKGYFHADKRRSD